METVFGDKWVYTRLESFRLPSGMKCLSRYRHIDLIEKTCFWTFSIISLRIRIILHWNWPLLSTTNIQLNDYPISNTPWPLFLDAAFRVHHFINYSERKVWLVFFITTISWLYPPVPPSTLLQNVCHWVAISVFGRLLQLTSDMIHLGWAVNLPVTGAVKQPVSEIELSGLRGRI